jgi:4-hydroxybutyrate CoA-transferase
MTWLKELHARRADADAAVALVPADGRVFVGGNGACPVTLLRRLAARAPELGHVEVVHVLLVGEDPFRHPEVSAHLRHNSLFVGPADRAAIAAGLADYTPVHLHDIPRLFASGRLPLDAALIQTSPPDEHGFLSLGVECLATMAAVAAAPVVIAEINPRMPRTLGDCFVHLSKVARVVEVDHPLPELSNRGFTEVESRIGRHIAGLVEDGSTLQLGIGGIPDAILASLTGHRELGVHTEMISDGLLDAVESGIVTGARKSLHKGKVVGTFALGTQRLYEYLHNNPMFEFHPCDYTNNPAVVAGNDKMVSVNSAIEVDLTGQVCADSIGTRVYSGFGGQLDFVRGARRSKGGKPVIALPSTAKNGAISRIAAMLRPGAGVVTTRADVHYVVTEHGVADLFGRSLRERALSLIGIADPAFREELARAARERKILPQTFALGAAPAALPVVPDR